MYLKLISNKAQLLNYLSLTGIFVISFLVYYFFPSHEPETDSYSIASAIKNKQPLIYPHHLLFKFIPYGFISLLKLFSPKNFEVIEALRVYNVLIGSFNAVLIFLILKKTTYNHFISLLLLCFLIVFGHGIWRFSSVLEVYATLIFFILLSILMYEYKKYTLSIFIGIIGLFIHQLAILWLISLFISLIIFKKRFNYLITFIIGIFVFLFIAYYAFLSIEYLYPNYSFLEFNLYSYLHHQGSFKIEFQDLVLLVVNSLRSLYFIDLSFIQNLSLYQKILYFLLITISLSSFLFTFLKNIKNINNNYFIYLIFIIVFGFMSKGNAEFLILIPLIVVLCFCSLNVSLNPKILFLALLPMLIVNIWGVYYHKSHPKPYHKLYEFAKKNKDSKLITQYAPQLLNISEYYDGKPNRNIMLSPSNYLMRYGENLTYYDSVNKLITQYDVFTDCIASNNLKDRTGLVEGKINYAFFNRYLLKEAKTLENFGKDYSLIRIEKYIP
jgi:hypothetical protein